MKKILFAFLIAGLVPAAAFAQTHKKHKAMPSAPAAAAQNDSAPAERSGAVANEPDTDGCGLGWQVTDKKTIAASITRGTTNGVIPPSFGMTTGTLGCSKHPFAKRDQQGVVYALTNYDSLNIEMAEGHGEYLEGLARSMGCNDAAFGEFSHVTQTNYRTISEGGKANAVKMFLNIKKQIKQNPALATNCNA
jgi:hypothetical protein